MSVELERICDKVDNNTGRILVLETEFKHLPTSMKAAVADGFTQYKNEKAKQKQEAAKSNGKWYKNQYILIGAIVALIQAVTKLIEAYTGTIGG